MGDGVPSSARLYLIAARLKMTLRVVHYCELVLFFYLNVKRKKVLFHYYLLALCSCLTYSMSALQSARPIGVWRAENGY